jgi:hypothetical protein
MRAVSGADASLVELEMAWKKVGLAGAGAVLLAALGAGASETGTARWRLAATGYPEGVTTEDELAEYRAARAADLMKWADQAEDRGAEFDRRVAVANWILAYQLEPMASRLFLGIPDHDDAGQAHEFLVPAVRQLERARAVLGQAGEEEAARVKKIEVLEAFAAALTAHWGTPDTSPEQRDQLLREAGFKLAAILEHERRDVADAALMWQACLFGQRGQFERAMDLIPLVLQESEPSTGHAYFAGLWRCRYMAEQIEGWAAALALLMRLEAGTEGRFADFDRRREARAAAALCRRQILGQWLKALRNAGEPERAAWCERAIARLDRGPFGAAEPAELLRLGTCVSDVADLEEALKAMNKSEPGAVDVKSGGLSHHTRAGVDGEPAERFDCEQGEGG